MKMYARWHWWDKLGGIAVLLGLLLLLAMQSAKYVESRFFPVMRGTEITGLEAVGTIDRPLTRVSLSSTKIRDCDWIGIEWYLGEVDGRAARVPARFEDKPQIRDKGFHKWDSLMIGLPEGFIIDGSYGMVTHRCHGGWTTTTVFYPSEAYQ